MLNLDPYEPVSNQPAISRDISICVADPDMELLGDRIRDSPKAYDRLRLFTIQSGFRILHSVRASVPRDAIYLNIAQHAFEHHRFFRWLGHRPDVVPVFLIHDLLPLDFSEFFPQGYELRFRRRVGTMVQRARETLAGWPLLSIAPGYGHHSQSIVPEGPLGFYFRVVA